MLVNAVFSLSLGRVVVADHWPAIPFLEAGKGLFCANALPCQQANHVADEQIHVLAAKARSGLVVAFVSGVINQ